MVTDQFQQGVEETYRALEPLTLLAKRPTASLESLERLREASRVIATNPPSDVVSAFLPDDPGSYGTIEELRAVALACVKCSHLVASRTGVVFGVGNPRAEIMFVGEAPGADEDVQGEPFVGRAGQLLTKIITAMGFTRDEVFIANVLKCRPDMPKGSTGNRKPTASEMSTCLPWLERQIELIRPKVLVALGGTALEGLLGAPELISRARGRWRDFRSIPVMPTYHPSFLLRGERLEDKRKVWEDMLLVLEKIGRPISEKQRRYFTAAGGS